MNARAYAKTERLFTCHISQPPPRKLCVDDESLDSLGWCALVPPLFWVPRIRVGLYTGQDQELFSIENPDNIADVRKEKTPLTLTHVYAQNWQNSHDVKRPQDLPKQYNSRGNVHFHNGKKTILIFKALVSQSFFRFFFFLDSAQKYSTRFFFSQLLN